MRVEITKVIPDYDGKPIKETARDGSEHDLTYREVFSTALNAGLPDEKILPEEKSRAYQITHKIFAGKDVSLTVDEAALIKERVGKIYNPLVYGRVCDELDGPAPTTAPVQPPTPPEQPKQP